MSAEAAQETLRFSASANVRACELDGELVLLDIIRGEYFGLGDLGSKAWARLADGQPVVEIARELVDVYEVELPVLVRDLLSFARELRNAGLLVGRAP
jgi:hypothetical protein